MGFFSKIKKLWKDQEEKESYKNKENKQEHSVTEHQSSLTVRKEQHELLQSETIRPSQETEVWKKELRQSLQQAEPRLSVWLDLILQGVKFADEKLWKRLSFLFQCLEVPPTEANDFIQRFKKWLKDMEYERVEEFRSELQYRLALALDLEDEEDEKSRLFFKLSKGLSKTKEQLSKKVDQLVSRNPEFNENFWEELEEILIMADVGFKTSLNLVNRLKNKVKENRIQDPEEFKTIFKQELASVFFSPPKKIKPYPPEVFLIVGVNGTGKTTTIAKLAHRAQMQGRKVLIVAGDTFRAAAIEQLEIWAKRVGAGFYAKEANSDPAAVAYEALEYAKDYDFDLILVDTAGRLHTKVNLMDELKKIKRVMNNKNPGAPHKTILVVDGTTGQNAISQTKLFHQGVGVDEIILTKLDGTAKGGVILSIAEEFALPITFVGLGEKMEDLRPFDGHDFAQALLS